MRKFRFFKVCVVLGIASLITISSALCWAQTQQDWDELQKQAELEEKVCNGELKKVEERVVAKTQGWDTQSRNMLLQVVLDVYDKVRGKVYYEPLLVAYEALEVAKLRISNAFEQAVKTYEDRSPDIRKQMIEQALQKAIEQGIIVKAADKCVLNWRKARGKKGKAYMSKLQYIFATGIKDGSIQESTQDMSTIYQATNENGKHILKKMEVPLPAPVPAPSFRDFVKKNTEISGLLFALDYRNCVNVELLRDSLLEKFTREGEPMKDELRTLSTGKGLTKNERMEMYACRADTISEFVSTLRKGMSSRSYTAIYSKSLIECRQKIKPYGRIVQ